MHGRSLVRTLDAGVVVIVTIAVTLLGVLAWAARAMDHTAFETETTIVHRQLGRLAAEFRAGLPQASGEGAVWLATRPQERAILRRITDRPEFVVQQGSRIGQLLGDSATAQRLRQTLDGLRKLDPRRQRVDFALIGPAGDESLAMIAQQAGADEPGGLLVSLLDFAALSIELEGLSINLLPALPASANPESSSGRVLLSGYSGDPVAVLGWSSHRFSSHISNYVMPVLAGILGVGLVVLMMLRHYWTVARDGFMRDLRAVETVAFTDSLTGLPNRRALFDQFRTIETKGGQFQPLTLLLLDLSGLKWVNEFLGHRVGDQVIVQSAGIFAQEFGQDAFVARLGGDAFVAVAPGDLTGPELQGLYARLSKALRERILTDHAGVQIGLNLGAVCSAQYPGSCEELLRLADLAVVASKADPHGAAVVYAPSMKEEKLHRRKLERELSAAIEEGDLVLHHQPIVDAMTGKKVLGYESLVRWNHPERGLVPPGEFIAVAEQSDLIVHLGNYVLDRALAELGPLAPCRISVNATGRQLLSKGFVDFVRGRLEHHGVPASRLCLELTETSLIEDGEGIDRVMGELRALGVVMAIDDFGVGYSSLSHLLRFKFDVLKIDRDFVANLDDKPESPMIVTSVVSLARSLGMQVVGEGIETPAQHRFLASAGCNALQGYLFGRPMPVFNLGLQADSADTSRKSSFQAA